MEATGLRIKVSNGAIDIDEIEVNTAASRPLPKLKLRQAGEAWVLSWTSGGGLETATSVTGPWVCLGDAVSPYPLPPNPGPLRFYRVRR